MSLGVIGNTSRLPGAEILEITTMCGHHQISHLLVEDLIKKVKAKTLTPHEAALKAAAPCPCGIVNIPRTEKIFAKLAMES